MNSVIDIPWDRVSELVVEMAGLYFPPERHIDLRRGIGEAAAELGYSDAESCAEALLSGQLSKKQSQTLIEHLTIGETYFFRDKRTFDLLAEQVLPELIRSRRGRDQRLRFWSAACCTGEEPYSLAILLHQLLPDLADWNVTILATDINEKFLRKAAAAVYGEWSFRETPHWVIDRFFFPTEEGKFAVRPEIKNAVKFAPLNLVEDGYPSPFNDIGAMDLIFCRNVLMYFTVAQARQVVRKLNRALTNDGWLVAGPSEGSHTMSGEFIPVSFPGVILYKKNTAENRQTLATRRYSEFVPPQPTNASTPTAAQDQACDTISRLNLEDRKPAPPQAQKEPSAKPDFSSSTRELANQGKLQEALKSCERWIASDKLDPAGHYLHAVILQEIGEKEQARRSLQRAIYLQPEFVLAHVALANLSRTHGKLAEAKKHFSNALVLLDTIEAQDLLPESDGMTAGQLAETIRGLIAISPRNES